MILLCRFTNYFFVEKLSSDEEKLGKEKKNREIVQTLKMMFQHMYEKCFHETYSFNYVHMEGG